MKKILFALIALISILSATAQIDYEVDSGDGVYNVVLSDSAYLDTTGTDTGDTLSYDYYVKPFAKYVKYNATLSRTTGSYTKAKVYLYSTMNYNRTDVGWSLIDSLTFADTITNYVLQSSLDTIYTQYLRIKVAPYDSLQAYKPRLGVLVQTE